MWEFTNIDCFDGMSKMADKSVDLVVTDPPYWHHKCPDKKYAERKCHTNHQFGSSSLYSPEGKMYGSMSQFNVEKIGVLLPELVRLCKIPNIYLFCNESQVPYYCKWADDNGLMFSILVWEKPLSIINKNRFSQNVEFIVRIYDYGTALNRIEDSAIYNRIDKTPPIRGKAKIHPTQKPLDVIAKYIRLSSNEGDTILDPFGGSGTTVVASHLLKRNCISFEADAEIYSNAIRRVKMETSQMELL